MKILKDELTETTAKRSYDEFELYQVVVELAVNDKLEILVNGVQIKEYIAKYINCHFNVVIQDKGVKKEATI